MLELERTETVSGHSIGLLVLVTRPTEEKREREREREERENGRQLNFHSGRVSSPTRKNLNCVKKISASPKLIFDKRGKISIENFDPKVRNSIFLKISFDFIFRFRLFLSFAAAAHFLSLEVLRKGGERGQQSNPRP